MQTTPQTESASTSFASAISTLNGYPEISAAWVASHRDAVRLVDVREPHELTGPLGAVEGVDNVPLNALLDGALRPDPNRPTVLICRSGRRSMLAVENLLRRGFTDVASVEGGMLAWNFQVFGKSGIHEDEKHANAANLLGAIDRTNGVAEVSAKWVRSNLGRFRLVDVRESGERSGPMGLIAQAEHVPLGQLMNAAKDWPKDQPLVIHCASGGRSARAALALEAAGFSRVASMEGGIMVWRALGLR
ncbi:MAG: rhodanese-like domain-containing protein [Myxococcales bacterium]|nr:rhodanese-like domain-containing protein [Myxococcales bacterium]